MTCFPAGDQSVLDGNMFASTDELDPSATYLCQLLKERVCFNSFGGKDKESVSLYITSYWKIHANIHSQYSKEIVLRSQEVAIERE